jgi:cobalt-precorrin-5B (C1)-methyltransferase
MKTVEKSGSAPGSDRLCFPLEERAANGLRRGYTTGTCATAAVKSALLHLLCRENPATVNVSLADGQYFLPVPIDCMNEVAPGVVRVDVIKEAGDDPDQTHRARIWAEVCRNETGKVRFLRGEGVGLVTQKGLQVPIGEPAINPEPRRMMARAVQEVLAEADLTTGGFDLKIGCEKGAEIARRTFNPRLGIEGGISILGTSGIVEPKSLASFKASIEIYIRVALAENPEQMVLAPGNLGQRFSRTFLQLPLKQVVQMSNFVGFALDSVEQTLVTNGYRLPLLWVVGHPGKLAKILDDVWDTHSQLGNSAVAALAGRARQFDFPESVKEAIAGASSAESVQELLLEQPNRKSFWESIERSIAERIRGHLKSVTEVKVRLFQMNGQLLSQNQ